MIHNFRHCYSSVRIFRHVSRDLTPHFLPVFSSPICCSDDYPSSNYYCYLYPLNTLHNSTRSAECVSAEHMDGYGHGRYSGVYEEARARLEEGSNGMHHLQARGVCHHHPGETVIKLMDDRIRKIKCDERKPQCFKCTSTGRKCDGYQLPGQSGRLVHNISLLIPGTRKERRAFEFFRSCTRPEFCSYFSDEFWERNILQASFSHPAIRHSIVALGALHEDYSIAVMQPDGKPTRGPGYFALRQHTIALSNLSKSLSGSKSLSSNSQLTHVALMSSIVLSCFDRLIGDVDSAVTHLRSGLEILRNTTSAGLDFDSYFRILKRMTMQSVSFLDTDKEETKLNFWEMAILDPCNDLPRFTSICEAQYSLHSIICYVLYFLNAFPTPKSLDAEHGELIKHQKNSLLFSVPGMSSLDSQRSKDALRLFAKARMEWVMSQNSFLSMLQAWSRKFHAFLKDSNLNLPTRDLQTAALLEMHWLHFTIIIEGTISPVKFSSPDFIARFQKIIALCKSIVAAENAPHAPQFSIELGIICPLYFTGLNCCDPGIRQQALELLATPRREGMWDSQVTTYILNKIHLQEKEAEVQNRSDISTSQPTVIRADIPNRSLREVMETARREMGTLGGY
jgi:hypothetical protein